MKKIIFISNYDFLTDTGEYGMSGGDRIYIELIKKWKLKNQILLFGTEEAVELANKNGIRDILFLITHKKVFNHSFSFLTLLNHNINRLLISIKATWNNLNLLKKYDFIYSVSDFYPDILPALILKLKRPKIKWVAAFYFFAPKPWSKNNPYNSSLGRWLTGFFYWLTQLISYKIIVKFANFVVLCNKIDEQFFIKDGFIKKNIITIYGGVDVDFANSIYVKNKIYDAVFMARFHSQKGPLYAAKAWKEVVKQKPNAKLAMIGDGPEESTIREYIKQNVLEKNIDLFGFLDGEEKYKILKSAKIYIHSAIYETGGMAAAEAMAAGLPVIAFNQKGYDYIYPKGILRIKPIGNYKKLAKGILDLISNKKLYMKLKIEALDLVKNEWDWSKRADFVYEKITAS